MKYLVTPQERKTGNKAPGIVVEVSEGKDAPEVARKMSRLGSMDNWDFNRNVKKLKENQNTIINRKKKFEDE
jgi:hypothetical protein